MSRLFSAHYCSSLVSLYVALYHTDLRSEHNSKYFLLAMDVLSIFMEFEYDYLNYHSFSHGVILYLDFIFFDLCKLGQGVHCGRSHVSCSLREERT